MSMAETWVSEAIQTLSLTGRVRRIDEPERSDVLRRVTDAFLKFPTVTFWWEHLKVPSSSCQAEQGYAYLPQLVPDPENACWLIADLTAPNHEMEIYLCTPSLASAVIGECPGFEYAIVDPDLKWIVIENHHEFLIATGEASARLSQLLR